MFLTNAPRYSLSILDARHRGRGRCENRICALKNTGLGRFPYFAFAADEAWANQAMFAMNLLSWIQLSILTSVHAAGIWDAKRWWYRVFSVAGKLVPGGRQTILRLPRTAP